MYNTLSITKAAIGLLYHIHDNEFSKNLSILYQNNKLCSIGDALNMCSGRSTPWNYYEYRHKVENNDNLLTFASAKIANAPLSDGMEYDNLLYQVLASIMKDVAFRFALFMEDKIDKELKEEQSSDGQSIYFIVGTGWKWEHTKNKEPLGPQGLHMTFDAAQKFAQKAKQIIEQIDFSEEAVADVSVGAWEGLGKNYFTRYWHGWWMTPRCFYAVGYVTQAIAITPNGIFIQLYEEDWKDCMDSDKHRWKHKRWDFVKNIEEQYKLFIKF
tara:strand:- start:10994 stop:11803 length:810 start_codon:yes stop_codon:yes gene_type:complete